MYINMVMDSIMGVSFSEKTEDPMIYYEMYKVIPLETIGALTISRQDSALIVNLSDETYLFPSGGGEYKLVDLLGDGATTFTEADNYIKYSEQYKFT